MILLLLRRSNSYLLKVFKKHERFAELQNVKQFLNVYVKQFRCFNILHERVHELDEAQTRQRKLDIVRYLHTCSKEIHNINKDIRILYSVFASSLDMSVSRKTIVSDGLCQSECENEKELRNLIHTTPKNSQIVSPPTEVKGMKTLNKVAFDKDIEVLAAVVQRHAVQQVCKQFSNIVLKVRKVKFVVDYPHINDDDTKLILLDPDRIPSVENFEPYKQKLFQNTNINVTNLVPWKVHLSYENWSWTEILEAILPDELSLSTFSCIGHIAHLNLRPELLEYKHLIGQVILEKHLQIRTVVNKLGQIDNKYRNFQMELLAGEADFMTTVREQGLQYKFDFAKVYWNTRLGTEHNRVCKMMKRDDVLFDVFAGVGPFAIPCARKGITVFANDLNPCSYQSMVENMKLNHIKPEKMSCFNVDGREFIRTVVKEKLVSLWTGEFNDHVEMPCQNVMVVMNLPALAVEFLDEFVGILSDHMDLLNKAPEYACFYPRIVCYGFQHVMGPDAEEKFTEKAERIMGVKLPVNHTLRIVRDVSPNKLMVCLHFTLEKEIIFRAREKAVNIEQIAESTDETQMECLKIESVCDGMPEEKKRKLDSK